jgi:opacity protein-like surface antigen
MTIRTYKAGAVLGLMISIGIAAPTSAAESRQYLGVNIGLSQLNIDESEIEGLPESETGTLTSLAPTLLDDSDTAWSLTYGYQFSRNFSLEASYVNFGEAKYSQTAQDYLGHGWQYNYSVETAVGVQGFSLVGVAVFPVGNFELNGNLGVLYAQIETSWSGTRTFFSQAAGLEPAQEFSESESSGKVGFLFGVGAGYKISERLQIRADWTMAQAIGDISSLTAGLRYRMK